MNTLSRKVDADLPYVADLDQALDVVGIGTYNLKYCFVLAMFLIASIVDPVGNAYLLPASKCDLEMSPAVRGFIASVPYIGIILSAFVWGYLADVRGRRPVLITASLGAGIFGIAAGFMPNLISFMICKSIASLCIGSPVAAPFSYIGEIVPQKYRDVTVAVVNSLQTTGAALVPVYAWIILPTDFRVDFGVYEYRPWRLLCMVYSLHYVLPAMLLLTGPESPKYLVSQGRHDDAMDVLKTMYAGNKGKTRDDFPIKALKMPAVDQNRKVGFIATLAQQTAPLLKPMYLKWVLLNGFVLFGIFNVLNGLAMWVPDSLNKVFSGSSGIKATACEVIVQSRNTTQFNASECVDTIDVLTYYVNGTATIACAVIGFIASSTVKVFGKKPLLILVLFVTGLGCFMINFTTEPMVFAVMLSTTTLTAIAIGPVNAYSVEIFPTNLRAMAIGLTMTIGRSGSFVGANLAGAMIHAACEAMFYMFGGLLALCCGLSCFLPRSKAMPPKKRAETVTRL